MVALISPASQRRVSLHSLHSWPAMIGIPKEAHGEKDRPRRVSHTFVAPHLQQKETASGSAWNMTKWLIFQSRAVCIANSNYVSNFVEHFVWWWNPSLEGEFSVPGFRPDQLCNCLVRSSASLRAPRRSQLGTGSPLAKKAPESGWGMVRDGTRPGMGASKRSGDALRFPLCRDLSLCSHGPPNAESARKSLYCFTFVLPFNGSQFKTGKTINTLDV